jgi:hypothetical protein
VQWSNGRTWKILGLAGFAGVAATGVVVVRAERRRRAYTPDEIRARLHERLAAADDGTDPTDPRDPADASDAGDAAAQDRTV